MVVRCIMIAEAKTSQQTENMLGPSPLINSDQGIPSLAIDLTKNEQKINDFIQKLEDQQQ